MAVLFPQIVLDAARAEQVKWRIPMSTSMAQWAVESAWGKRVPPGSNNPFGVMARCKGPRGSAGFALDGTPIEPHVAITTHEVINGKRIKCVRPLRAFASLEDAFDRHGELLRTGAPYAEARLCLRAEPWTEGAVEAFTVKMASRYATDPSYGRLLISIMRHRNLYRFNI